MRRIAGVLDGEVLWLVLDLSLPDLSSERECPGVEAREEWKEFERWRLDS